MFTTLFGAASGAFVITPPVFESNQVRRSKSRTVRQLAAVLAQTSFQGPRLSRTTACIRTGRANIRVLVERTAIEVALTLSFGTRRARGRSIGCTNVEGAVRIASTAFCGKLRGNLRAGFFLGFTDFPHHPLDALSTSVQVGDSIQYKVDTRLRLIAVGQEVLFFGSHCDVRSWCRCLDFFTRKDEGMFDGRSRGDVPKGVGE